MPRKRKELFDKQRQQVVKEQEEQEEEELNAAIKKTHCFDIGDVVLVLKRYVKKGQARKLTHLWKGPYVVVNAFPNSINYEVNFFS